ncbi:MAG: hypothetical protein HOJ48_12265 [Desulfobacula sp.]|nr:hypothetical protein [Desulfobacula sp.]MBT7260924.1 hypothetical protein [Desulfobacula sp.]
MKNIAFNLGMGTLFTHELDAMQNHEWIVLPLTSWLPDEYGMMVFLVFHIPFFAGLIALVSIQNDKIRIPSKLAISLFLIVHSVLHVVFMSHADYEFSSVLSNALIFGGALFGIVYLLYQYNFKEMLFKK